MTLVKVASPVRVAALNVASPVKMAWSKVDEGGAGEVEVDVGPERQLGARSQRVRILRFDVVGQPQVGGEDTLCRESNWEFLLGISAAGRSREREAEW